MAMEFNVEPGEFFIGTNKTLRIHILGEDGNPIDTSGWTLLYVIAASPTSSIRKVTKGNFSPYAGITNPGAFSADKNLNQQRVLIQFSDVDTEALKPVVYHHSLKRMDTGYEDVLFHGTIEFSAAAAR
jgi:hypothetical protein